MPRPEEAWGGCARLPQNLSSRPELMASSCVHARISPNRHDSVVGRVHREQVSQSIFPFSRRKPQPGPAAREDVGTDGSISVRHCVIMIRPWAICAAPRLYVSRLGTRYVESGLRDLDVHRP